MSRAMTGDTIVQKPRNNVYTVLAIVGAAVAIAGLAILYFKAQSLSIKFF